jgi:hypothetical protein
MSVQLDGNHVEGVFGQFIVVVEEGNELPSGQLQGCVTALRDMTPAIPKRNPDPGVFLLILLEDPPHVGSLRSVISNAQLPVRIKLISDGLNGPPKPWFGSVVGGHDYRNQWFVCEVLNVSADRTTILFSKGIIHSDPFLVISGGDIRRKDVIEKPSKLKLPARPEIFPDQIGLSQRLCPSPGL